MAESEKEKVVLESGKIYFFAFGGNTQIVGRYRDSDVCRHNFFDILHYWNGYETFRKGQQYIEKGSIESYRRASKPEIHNLIKHEIENDCL